MCVLFVIGRMWVSNKAIGTACNYCGVCVNVVRIACRSCQKCASACRRAIHRRRSHCNKKDINTFAYAVGNAYSPENPL